jgi:hypothetical protein
MVWGAFTMNVLINQINSGHPVVLGVDSDADGIADHAILAIGYNVVTNQYAAYNTWDQQIHWYDFAGVAPGQYYGISMAVIVTPS